MDTVDVVMEAILRLFRTPSTYTTQIPLVSDDFVDDVKELWKWHRAHCDYYNIYGDLLRGKSHVITGPREEGDLYKLLHGEDSLFVNPLEHSTEPKYTAFLDTHPQLKQLLDAHISVRDRCHLIVYIYERHLVLQFHSDPLWITLYNSAGTDIDRVNVIQRSPFRFFTGNLDEFPELDHQFTPGLITILVYTD